MNQTTNYGFNVPIGSDIVNPLVQDFPNWETLDTLLRNVANTGITTATHTKSGTIHTLSFSDITVPMIRFQATADFNTNDTFTVNGLSVSALTVAGESLPDGAFVIGSMVLCELRDNLLTVYSSGSDASTLEGHPASYFATDSDLQTVDGKADANKVLIDQINDDLSEEIIASITGDGVSSTYALLNRLAFYMALIDNDVSLVHYIGDRYIVHRLTDKTANSATFSAVFATSTTNLVDTAIIASTSYYKRFAVNTDNGTLNYYNLGADIAAVTESFKLIKNFKG